MHLKHDYSLEALCFLVEMNTRTDYFVTPIKIYKCKVCKKRKKQKQMTSKHRHRLFLDEEIKRLKSLGYISIEQWELQEAEAGSSIIA